MEFRGQTMLMTFEKNFSITNSMRQNDVQQSQIRKTFKSICMGEVSDYFSSLKTESCTAFGWTWMISTCYMSFSQKQIS